MMDERGSEDWLPHDQEEPQDEEKPHAGDQSEANCDSADAEWSEPSPLGAELPAVLPFTEGMLPEVLRGPVVDTAARMQVPLEFPAAAAMLCLAGAVNRRARIQPKKEDNSWKVTPNLWGGLVGLPGVLLKSPVLNVMAKPLYGIQALWRESFQSEKEAYEEQKEAAELRLQAWKEKTKAAHKAGKEPPMARPDTSLRVPTQQRLIINDATSEASHAIMANNPAGLFLIRDELMGWLSLLERVGREGERALCLEAWNGDTSHTIDRVGRGEIHVPACCLSIVGGITPGRLRSYLVEALKDGPSNDGLIQRFQVLVYPDVPPDWRYVDRIPTPSRITDMYERLILLDPEDPVIFRFSPEAQEFFIGWLTRLEKRLRSGELNPAMASHLGKYPKLMVAVAGLSALADGAPRNDKQLLELCYAEQGATWCTRLESHARRIYSCVLSQRMQAAADLAAKIRKKTVGADGTLMARDVYRHGWGGLDTPASVGEALDILEDAGWVRHQWEKPGPKGGRPPDRWQVNPRIFKGK
jgi:putative DNA primase/helicase